LGGLQVVSGANIRSTCTVPRGISGGPYLVAHYKTVRLAEEDRILGLGWVAANHSVHYMVSEELAHGQNWVEVEVVIVGVGSRRNLEVFPRSAGAAEAHGGKLTGTAAEEDNPVVEGHSLVEVVRSLAVEVHSLVEVVGHSWVVGEGSRRVAGLPGIVGPGRTWL